MNTLKEMLRNNYGTILALDYNDRKVQIKLACSAVSVVITLIIVKKLSKKRNYFDEMPPFIKDSVEEIGDPMLLSNIKLVIGWCCYSKQKKQNKE
eukprot:365004_1